MKPKLKEDPREWSKFVTAGTLFLSAGAWLLWRRRALPLFQFEAVLSVLAVVLLMGWVRPRWFRGIYRVVMTGSFYVGQVVGRVLLALIFLGVLAPLGLILRITGKDLLRLRRNTSAASYWQAAKVSEEFDRQF
jgi:hypothetical protein